MRHIPSSCLDHLTPTDFIFIQEALLNGESQLEALYSLFQDRESLVTLLEHDKLFAAIDENPYPLSISPELYFFVLVRRHLKDTEIDELHIAEYVAATLAAHSIGNPMTGLQPTREDRDFTCHVDFIDGMEGLSNCGRFFLQLQCGNSAMALTGIFPEFIEHHSNRKGAPPIDHCEEVTRCAFHSTSKHPFTNEFNFKNVYPILADKLDDTKEAPNHLAQDYIFLSN